MKGKFLSIINCPINKKLLTKDKIGVTEYLASKCKLKDHSEVMLIKGEKFSVCPITTHSDLREISKQIRPKLIIKKLIQLIKNLKDILKKNPILEF